MWSMSFRLTLALLVGGILSGQGVLRLKNGVSPGESTGLTDRDVRRPHRAWEHFIIETGPDTPSGIREILKARGARVLRAVPDSGFLIAAPPELDTSGLLLKQTRRMEAREKLSSYLGKSNDRAFYMVEFHPDVEDVDARAVLQRLGLAVRENPDLLPGHLLVKGFLRSLIRLAESDEVAYVFPASPELVNGDPVHGCAGALTASGTVGQYIAAYGDGWDGPGLGSASLKYAYARLTEKQPRDVVISVLANVMAEWSRAANLTFTYADRVDGPRTLTFLFAAGQHGDAYPFDGPGKVLAHTFYPSPPNPEPIAGDLHFDDDEHWAVGADIDIFSVVLHEMGHALGLGHADQPGAVMYPYYSRVTKLTQDDITAIQQLYAATLPSLPTQGFALTLNAVPPATTTASVISISGAVSGGFGQTVVTWRTDRGASGTATGVPNWGAGWIPLLIGPNVLTVTATDSQHTTVSKVMTIARLDVAKTVPQIAITPPPSTNFSTRSVTLTGTASAAAGIAVVRWNNSRGSSGVATGTTSWSANISLFAGSNVITVTATTTTGTAASATISLNYAAPLPATDTTAPSLTITSPSATVVSTTATTIRITGTARDNVCVTEVNWGSSTRNAGIAMGTVNWSATVPLLVGDNTITVRAKDAAGNVGWRSIVVSRR